MKIYKTILYSAMIFAIIFTNANSQVRQRGILLDKQIKVEINNGSIWEAVQDISRSGIPVGFEFKDREDINNSPRIVLKSGKLEDVLNSLVLQDNSYTWEVKDGVVNIFPAKNRNEILKSLLSTTVDPIIFPIGEKNTVVLDKIRKSPDIIKFLNEHHGLGLMLFRFNYIGKKEIVVEEIKVPKSEFKDVLNTFVGSNSDGNLWMIDISKDSKVVIIAF